MSSAPKAQPWPLGYSPSSIHHCKPNDSSTWKLLPVQPVMPEGQRSKKLWQCKGCSAKMLR